MILTNFSDRGRGPRLAVLAGSVFFLFSIGSPVTHAQQDSPAERAMRKAQGMLRQLSSEKKALETKNAVLEAELAKTKAELSGVQQEVNQQHSVNNALAQNNAVLVERINSDHRKLLEIIEQYRAKQTELKTYQQDHVLLKNAIIERSQWITDCQKHNAALIDAGKELLVRYDNKSVWDSIAGIEPALGIGKVEQEIENQEYRFKLEDLKVRPPAAAPMEIPGSRSPPQSPGSTKQENSDHPGDRN